MSSITPVADAPRKSFCSSFNPKKLGKVVLFAIPMLLSSFFLSTVNEYAQPTKVAKFEPEIDFDALRIPEVMELHSFYLDRENRKWHRDDDEERRDEYLKNYGTCGTMRLGKINWVDGPSPLENLLTQIPKSLADTSSEGLFALAIAGGLLTIAAAKGALTYSNSLLPSKEEWKNTGAWTKVAYGAAHYPLAQLAGHASVMAGVAAKFVNPKTVNAMVLKDPNLNPLIAPLIGYNLAKMGAPEEIEFRTVFQDLLLKQVPLKILNRIFPSKAELVNHPIAKITRVALSSLLFAAYHLLNRGILPPEIMNYQLCNTFGTGLMFGTLQEMTDDTWASVGAHAAFNFMTIINKMKLSS